MTSAGPPNPIAPTSDGAQYDFGPFISAPAVVERAKEHGGVISPLHIPGSTIPSPLAREISPDQLLGLKARLVGSGPTTSSRTGNGREVWLSWKRAWDLWNNHYIHGRVNPVWVKGQLERGQKEQRKNAAPNRASGEVSDVEMTDQDGDRSDEEVLDGGFRAIKDFPEFKAPPPFDPELGDDGIIWDDPINNTVWAPRRVGEKTVKVDLDVDLDEFQRNSDLERDRGVDCGRLPYPALRPLLECIRLESGAIIKKKIWDGVTGTVFNLPTKPLEPTREPEDKKLKTVGTVFGDPYGHFDPKIVNEDIFPLDIRRVKRVYPPPQFPDIIPPLLDNAGDTILYNRHTRTDLPVFNYREIWEDDPWYVTEEQRILIDYPPRRYPAPEQKYKPVDIPIDDTIFREEFDSDQLKFTAYFVTNQHGGTLIINGVEVQRGDIAGPLPNFAVIECPGGQIAFWFGSYGRNHLSETEESPYIKWLDLRQRNGWKYTGLSAGQVWDAKVKDRIERKRSGEDEHDDEQWEEWLSATTPQKLSTSTSVSYQLPLPGQIRGELLPLPDNISQPHVMFPSERHELAWLTAQLVQQEMEEDAMDIDVLPGETQFFPGSQSRSDYFKDKRLTQDEVDDIWLVKGEHIQELQRIHVGSIRDKEERKAQAEEERLRSYSLPTKRKSEELLKPVEKKAKAAVEALPIREKELEEGSQGNLERSQEDRRQETIKQMENGWSVYMACKRKEQRKQKNEKSTTMGKVRKQGKAKVTGKHRPSADPVVKLKILYDREEAVKAGQLQVQKDQQRAQEEAQLHPSINSIGNSINRQNVAQYGQLKESTAAQSSHPTTITQTPEQLTPNVHINTNNSAQNFDTSFNNFNPSSAPPDLLDEDQALLQAIELSKQSFRDNAKQAFTQNAIAAYKTVPEYLREQGFSTMKEYLDAFMSASYPTNPANSEVSKVHSDPAQQDLESFRATLKQAYAEGSKARARLQDMTWDKYTDSETSLNPKDYLDVMVQSTNITVNHMPPRVNKDMSINDEAIRREKWSILCDHVIEANDFESQTQVASLTPMKHRSVDGKRYAVL